MKIVAKITVIKEDNGKIDVIEDNTEIQPTSITYKTEKGIFKSNYKFGFTVKVSEDLKTKEDKHE